MVTPDSTPPSRPQPPPDPHRNDSACYKWAHESGDDEDEENAFIAHAAQCASHSDLCAARTHWREGDDEDGDDERESDAGQVFVIRT